jgi:hypothetical protein
MTGPDMKEYLKTKAKASELNGIYWKDRAEKAELKAKYYQGQYDLLIKRHRAAFEYMNGLYMRVLGKLKRAISRK